MALDYAQDRIHVCISVPCCEFGFVHADSAQINALCPGFVRSPMIELFTANPEHEANLAARHPWNSIGRPEDIADAALFLCSDEA